MPSFAIFMITLPKTRPSTPDVSVKNWCEELVRRTIGLDAVPRKGYKVPELNEDAVRELGLYSYRILYEIKPGNLIEVLAVIHKRRHLEAEDIPREQ